MRLLTRFLCLAYFAIFAGQNSKAADDFVGQIQALQNQSKLVITGLDKIQNGEAMPVSGSMEQQIRQLFAGYNHIVSRNRSGRIERIAILGKKSQAKDKRVLLPIDVRDNHATVSVSLSGDGSNWLALDMVLDTGADLIVLPESMIPQLGLAPASLKVGRMQTANGTVNALVGQLREVALAGERIENVEVGFIADRLLGDNRLLGMSALNRFEVNIDNKAHVVTLIKK